MSALFYCVQTKSKAESLAEENLINQSFEVYFPTLIREKWDDHGAIIGSRIEPVFSGYLFVRFDIRDGYWRKISNSRGVEKLLGTNPERPDAIPDRVIDEIKQVFAAGGYLPARTPEIGAGDVCRVKSGSFADKLGKCLDRRKDRVWLLLSELGMASKVEFRASALTLVDRGVPASLGR